MLTVEICFLDNPVAASTLDGVPMRLFLDDEDDFAMLAENLFTDLDTEDVGKIRKSMVRDALEAMGTDFGIPPFAGLFLKLLIFWFLMWRKKVMKLGIAKLYLSKKTCSLLKA